MSVDEKRAAKFVCLGGGVAAGYWASTLAAEAPTLQAGGGGGAKPFALIVSAEPAGLAPYERSEVSKSLLDPDRPALRRLGAGSALPFAPSLAAGEIAGSAEPHAPAWYADKGVELMHSCVCVAADLDKKRLTLRTYAPGDYGGATTIELSYEKLLIATGARPTRLDGATPSKDAMLASLWPTVHADVKVALTEGGDAPSAELAFKEPGAYGFGSVHYLRDVADSAKLVAAMARLEDDGQETCYDPVVIVGGGYVAMETAAALVRGAPDLQVTMVIPGDHVLPSLFDPAQYAMASGGRDDDDDGGDGGAGASTGGAGSEPEKKDAGATNPDKLVAGVDKPSIIAEFYERQLVKAGVRFVRAHSVDRLWAVGEVGNFPTMEGPAISLQKTRPRPFGKAQPQFQQCRGVVLKSAHGGALAWLPARFVVLGLGATPNAELFASQLETARDGSLAVDENLCASHVSHDVFAAGDVATFPSPALQCNARLAHATCARAAGAYAARAMLDLAAGLEPFDPVPRITSRLLDLSWQFDGRTDGDVVVLGIDTFLSNKTFGAFWVHTHEGESRVVGVFLEGGTAAQREAAKQVAAECPRVINVRKLKRCGLEAFLADPGCLTPPQLAPGEFLAELDDEIVLEAFKRHDLAGQNTVKTGALGAIMRDLGADWDEDEVREAGIAMDPTGQGTVDYQTFLGWWMH